MAAPNFDFGSGAYGAVLVYFGADRALVYIIEGQECGRTGRAAARIPDHDGDGVDDLGLIEMHRLDGASYGDVVIRSGRDGALLARIVGDTRRFWSNSALLDTSGDIDGDGTHDIVVGGHWKSGATTGFAIAAYSGATRRLLFGRRVGEVAMFRAAAGADLDRDGDDELLMLTDGASGQRLIAYAGAPAFLDVSVRRVQVGDALDAWGRGRLATFSTLWISEFGGLAISPVLVVEPGILEEPLGFGGGRLPAGFGGELVQPGYMGDRSVRAVG